MLYSVEKENKKLLAKLAKKRNEQKTIEVEVVKSVIKKQAEMIPVDADEIEKNAKMTPLLTKKIIRKVGEEGRKQPIWNQDSIRKNLFRDLEAIDLDERLQTLEKGYAVYNSEKLCRCTSRSNDKKRAFLSKKEALIASLAFNNQNQYRCPEHPLQWHNSTV